MRIWEILGGQILDEAIYEPQHPIVDDIAQRHVMRDLENFKGDLVVIGTIGNLTLEATSWPLDDPSQDIFLFDGDDVVGQLVLLKGSGRYKGFLQTKSVYLWPKYRGGVGYALYNFLLDHGYRLCSDRTHTAASARLWQKLAADGRVSYNGEKISNPEYDGSLTRFVAESDSTHDAQDANGHERDRHNRREV